MTIAFKPTKKDQEPVYCKKCQNSLLLITRVRGRSLKLKGRGKASAQISVSCPLCKSSRVITR